MDRMYSKPRYDLYTLGTLSVIGIVSAFYVLGEGNDMGLGKLITPILGGDGGTRLTTPIPTDPTQGMDRGFTPADGSAPSRESYPIHTPDGHILYATVETISTGGLTGKEVDEIVAAAQSSFGAGMTREDVLAHLHGDVRVARDEGGKIIGFLTTTDQPPNEAMNTNVFETPQGKSMYIMGIAVSADAQGQGIATALIDDALKKFASEGYSTLSVRTQNQNVVDAVMHGLDRLKAQGVIQGYDPKGFVFPGHYGGQLAENTPRPVPGLDAERGDALGLSIKVLR